MSFDLKIQDGDLVISNGSLVTVTGSEKLLQDLVKIAITPAGSNPSFPWYGSFLSRTLIGSALDTSIILQVGKSQLQNSIKTLMDLQKAQVKTGQKISADEQIQSILDISVNRSRKDPRFFTVNIRVMSKSVNLITTSFEVSP